jgi:Uma2 family endonuclease
MAEPATKRMSVAEFLRWEDGTDKRYELLEGTPVALRLGVRIETALPARPPCIAQSEPGIARSDRDDTCYIADLAVTCAPPERGQQLLQDPLLIVEILSPGTALYDRQTKVADYRRMPSVAEILLIDSVSVFAEMLGRDGDRWITEVVHGREATLSLTSIGLTVAMSDLYDEIDVADPERARHPDPVAASGAQGSG